LLNYIAENGLALLLYFVCAKDVSVQTEDEHRDKKENLFFFFFGSVMRMSWL